jgi:quercetin dioxygenase-like cupin family protein
MMNIRRVVTGHDEHGKAFVAFDAKLDNFKSNRPGGSSATVWTSDTFPADNSGNEDAANRKLATVLEGGTVFRVVRYEPGVAPRNHRTDSIDYAVVLSGSIDMELDDTMVTLHAGDLLVQRGTVHNWVNRGTEDCYIAFVLVNAKPVTIDGKPLEAHG